MEKNDVIDIYKNIDKKIDTNIKKISVIIPNYNYEKFIEERIDSVLNQTYPIYELIILDDKSTDNSVEIIEEKIKNIKKIPVKFIQSKKNSGCPFIQWNKGINEASGDYFWIAEADDSADCHFLETTMKAFNDKDVVLSYTESARIDENNKVIATNSQDLYNIYNTDRWNSSYVNDGIDEIKNYLSITNTILNVSSVVWKNDNYNDILKEAQNYKVAGDWYIYYKVLERGKLAFSNKPYNYFRKHSKSVSTVVKADIEYKEICKLQEEIAKKYDLSMQAYMMQRTRRHYMDANVSKDVRKKRVAWVIPHPGKGSGGHRTIIQNVNALVKAGYECDIYVEEDYLSTSEIVKEKIDSYYGYCACKVYVGIVLRQEYDLLFATGWTTIDFVKNVECAKKAYFIQDYEPWFLPMGDDYIKTENSYRLGYSPITIGKWLSHKMISEFGLNSQYFDFCADLNIYKKLDNIEKENAICYIYQPEKPRRCDQIGLSALKIVKAIKPDVKIYLYGSNTKNLVPFEAEKLGIIPIEECNKLYNKCKIGFCISASNPSRIPFEMMAAGLPVVEIYKENNLYDFPKGAIKLAEPTPEAIATCIIDLLDNEKELKKMSELGYNYMKDYPLEKGFEQFVEAVNNLFSNKEITTNIKKTYDDEPYRASKEIKEQAKEILKSNNIIASGGASRRKLRRFKRKSKNYMKGALTKIINGIEKI